MADKVIPVPEEFVDRFKELVETDKKIFDLAQDRKIKLDSLWLEVARKLDLRDYALRFDKDAMTITAVDPKQAETMKMMEQMRRNKNPAVMSTPVGLSTKDGNALPKLGKTRKPFLKRLGDLLKSNP